jgi:hypothetical protein
MNDEAPRHQQWLVHPVGVSCPTHVLFIIHNSAFILLLCLATFGMVPVRSAMAQTTPARPTVVLVLGAPGQDEFQTNFLRQAELWTRVCARAQATVVRIGLDTNSTTLDCERLKQTLANEQKDGDEALWLVLVGHGTYDGKEARFNLRGPDVTATDFADWLKPFRRPVVFIDTSAASAPFLNRLSATNRVILTATRSGSEQDFTRFGLYLAEVLTDDQSDLDKDGQVSVLEAFLTASVRVAEFYRTEGRLATEHALLDDDGDGRGTPADWFRGIRPVKKPQGNASVDGAHAHQLHLVLSQAEQALPPDVRAKRDALELEIGRLRANKSQHPNEKYYDELEKLLLQLADTYGNRL